MAKILLVEDNEMNRDMLSRRLERRGYAVVIAEDGGAGIALAKSESPDLILMDMSLPVMNGFDFIQELRKNKDWQDIPVVILTAKDLTLEDRQQLKGNVERVYQKGEYNRDQLLNEVRELVKTRVQPGTPSKT